MEHDVMGKDCPLELGFKLENFKDFHNSIDCRVARTTEELEKAYHLVYREYLKRSYTKQNPSHLRLSLYNALPQTTTFLAITDNNEVVSTATIVPDSEIGLPMDDAYGFELDRLREDNKKLCEITMLASHTEFFAHADLQCNGYRCFFMLNFFKMLLDYVREELKLDYMCIVINPKYKLIFDHLLFKNIGGFKRYSDVNNAPAIAKVLDVHSVEEGFSKPGKERLYKIFCANKTNPARFKGKPLFSYAELKHFFTERTSIFQDADPHQLQYVLSCYSHPEQASNQLSFF